VPQVQEVSRGIRGAGGQPGRHLIQLGQQTIAVVVVAGVNLAREGSSGSAASPDFRS